MFNKRNANKNEYSSSQQNLELSNQQLQLQLLQMTSQYYNAQKDATYHASEFSKLKNIVENMCKSLLSNNYNTSQLGGNNILKNMNVFDLIEFSKNDFTNQKKQYMETIRSLKQQNDFYLQRNKELQESLNNALLSSAGIPDADKISNNEIIDNTYSEPVVLTRTQSNIPNTNQMYDTTQTPSSLKSSINQQQNVQSNQPQEQPQQSIKTETTMPKSFVINSVEAIVNTLSSPDWLIIEAIGSQGFSESTDICNWIYKEYPAYEGKRSVLLQSLSNLNKSQVLESQEISTGIRRTLRIYKLTNAGIEIYKNKYQDVPVEAECDKIARDHDNVKHGYTIKDTYTNFKNCFPIKSIEMDRSAVSIKLPNGETYIPDIVVNLNDGTTYYVEVELGNTEATAEKETNDFNKKCDKMFQVTKTFLIVSDTAEVKKKNDQKISTWMVKRGGKDKLPGLTVYSATVTDISKGTLGKPYIKL